MMLMFCMYVCVCIYMFTIPLSLLLLFRWQKHSFSYYLDFVFSGLETVLSFEGQRIHMQKVSERRKQKRNLNPQL